MPGYSPLPRIELDPRTEAQLVKAAARRVYEASNSTINDFSSGSPIMALLEGQAFSQAEFLHFANEFPEAVLVEWIGPFLGAQRRTGSGSTVDIEFTITPRDQAFEVFEGFQLGTDSNLTEGESFKFVTTERLSIPAGESKGLVRAISITRGTENNVSSNTITRTLTSLAGVDSITNPEPAVGGQDSETLSEVKERFFSLIRRRNPVSAEDWLDWFTDALGPGTSVTVRSRQSERDFYRYGGDYVTSNPAVSFYVLNPNGSPLTQPQKDALNTLLKWSLPTEFLGYIYSMEVDEADFFLDIEYDPNRPYAQNLLTLSQSVRDSLAAIMTPNAVFPAGYDVKVSDAENALTTSFPLVLGLQDRLVDPTIRDIKAYFTPQNASEAAFTSAVPRKFITGARVKENDLVVDLGAQISEFYRAVSDFEPVTNDKMFNVNVGNLEIKIIKEFGPGSYESGDVFVAEAGDLYIVLNDFDYSSRATIGQLIEQNLVSTKTAKEFVGEMNTVGLDGNYNPDVILFDQEDTAQIVALPSTPVDLNPKTRPGSPVYVVSKPFFVESAVTTLGSAKTAGLVEKEITIVRLLQSGQNYVEGEYVKTPNPSEMYSGSIDTETCYLTTAEGALEIFARVEKGFTLNTDEHTYSSAVQELIDNKTLSTVNTVPFVDCRGVATFATRPFRYRSRFLAGEYVRYRTMAGDPAPRFFLALRDFTPVSSNVDDMVQQGIIAEVTEKVFSADFDVVLSLFEETYSSNISSQLLSNGLISEEAELVPGQTASVTSPEGLSRGVFEWNGRQWQKLMPSLPRHRDLFRFAPGDVASFRNVSSIRNYVALRHVTPIMELDPYVTAGIFEETIQTETVKWVDPLYPVEDVVVNEVDETKSFYRVSRSFTPEDFKQVWNNNIVDNTPRIEELTGSLLKIVDKADCLDEIRHRLPNKISALKLGRCNLKLRSKSTGSENSTFVWENTEYLGIDSVLSHSPQTQFDFPTVQYGDGTLAL